MENPDEDDDLELVQASAGLLSELDSALPKLLFKPSKTGNIRGSVHTRVKTRDLDHIIKLIEPFQGEPQLLDAKLKHVLPPLVEAYIESLHIRLKVPTQAYLDLQTAVCIILYTLCKVRGHKVIVGFLNNEPRYLEPILRRLEDIANAADDATTEWHVPYILLLWLSHLLLTPFDLASFSDKSAFDVQIDGLDLDRGLPSVAIRALRVGLYYLTVSTKAQDAAAKLLVRLVIRPDMQKLDLANALVSKALRSLQDESTDLSTTVYEKIGPLRFLAGVTSSAELGHLVPEIYRTCEPQSNVENTVVGSNAVAKKMMVKILRNIAILSLRSASIEGPLHIFLETTGVLEDVIDHLLRSLGDRDTPVRYAAAKALSLLVLELEPEMGHEVVQAVLDSFKEDVPRRGEALGFGLANPLKWHGLTLALAHTLFKRSASPYQLPDIVQALVSALQFEQRTATGSSMGTNVRDAANFGIWSLSRRYTTQELLSVDITTVSNIKTVDSKHSVIQELATQLILSACLDPAGNIRRGSSAALQELIGRHPNEVHEGISLVQIVDYQAVGLRRRAIVNVARRAGELYSAYQHALIEAMLDWRGLGSPDVSSREATADSLANFDSLSFKSHGQVIEKVIQRAKTHDPRDVEVIHGLVLSLACLIDRSVNRSEVDESVNGEPNLMLNRAMEGLLEMLLSLIKDFSPRLLRSELPSATARLITAFCRSLSNSTSGGESVGRVAFESIDTLTERLLVRSEATIQQTIPSLVEALFTLKQARSEPLAGLGCRNLCKKVAVDASKSTTHGAGRAIAIGVLAPLYETGLSGEKAAAAIATLSGMTEAMNVDWRIIGIKALQLAIEGSTVDAAVDSHIWDTIVHSVHKGLNDYTIDERGDIGSLVRLQAISCTSSIFARERSNSNAEMSQILQADIYRLSLEKLDRVRLSAAQCRRQYLILKTSTNDTAQTSSYEFFVENLRPLTDKHEQAWKHTALLEGCVSCAGASAEPLLQASRSALLNLLKSTDVMPLMHLMSIFAGMLKSCLVESNNMHPALELLAFLLDMQVPQRLTDLTDFKWRNLLSTVQKAHHKSNDIPKILAAVHVYCGLADVLPIRVEVLKKLISMLKTNPYPRVRAAVAEALFVITRDKTLKSRDWMEPPSQHVDITGQLQNRYAPT